MSELPEQSVGSSEASPETAGPNAETTLLAENKAVVERKEAQRMSCDDGTLSIDMENSETEFPSLALMEIVGGKFFVDEFFNDRGAAAVSELDSDGGDDFMTPSEVRSMAMKRIGDLTSSESDSDDSVTSDKWISSYLVSASTMSLTRSICLNERCQLESFPSWSETFEECEESTALEMTEKDYIQKNNSRLSRAQKL
ncbi:Protein cft1 [Trichinella spiralis]|uniref:Protein cft1 n=1 Tax=Trichinella spiralis TaxID=6334 RepID=A0ABR3K5R6_TRISP